MEAQFAYIVSSRGKENGRVLAMVSWEEKTSCDILIRLNARSKEDCLLRRNIERSARRSFVSQDQRSYLYDSEEGY